MVLTRQIIEATVKASQSQLPGESRSFLSRHVSSFTYPVENVIEKLEGILLVEDIRLREKANIEMALQTTDWKIYGTAGAAELFNLKFTTLLSHLKKMKIHKTVETS